MRRILTLGAALALAGCATSSERVTLLDPAQAEKIANNDLGSLIVEHNGGETVINARNQQARLRGTERPPELTVLPETDPQHTELVSNFPSAVGTIPVPFEAVGSMELSEEQKTKVADELRRALATRIAPQIEVVGHTDTDGGAGRNQEISDARAQFVAEILKGMGFEIQDDDIIGRGESLAIKEKLPDGVSEEKYRRVDVIIR